MSEEDKKILDTVERIIGVVKSIEDTAKMLKERRDILFSEFVIPHNKNIDTDEVRITIEPEDMKALIPKRYYQSEGLYEERSVKKIEVKGREISIVVDPRIEGGETLSISLKRPSIRDILLLALNPKILDTVEEELRKKSEKTREDIERLKRIATLVEMALKE